MRARLALVTWIAGTAGAVAVLTAAGSGDLAAPPADPSQVGGWIEERGGVVAAFAVLRLVGLGLAWYILATSVAATVARLVGWAAAVSLTDAVALPAVRRLAESALAAGLTLGAVAPAAASAGAPPVAFVAQVSEAEPETASLRLIDPPPPAPALAPTPAGASHVVQPGDHLWSIAERTLATRLGRPPTEAEIVPYWRAVIDANAGAFVTGDPDLIFPGQTLELPSSP